MKFLIHIMHVKGRIHHMKKYYCVHCRSLHETPNLCHVCGQDRLKEIFITIQHNEKKSEG